MSAVLREVLATEISPELVPGEVDGQPAQRTEDVVGPYELQDFNLYYTLRLGYRPSKVAFLSWSAWRDSTAGAWPDIPEAARRAYGIVVIKRWLGRVPAGAFSSRASSSRADRSRPAVTGGRRATGLPPRGWRSLAQVPEHDPE